MGKNFFKKIRLWKNSTESKKIQLLHPEEEYFPVGLTEYEPDITKDDSAKEKHFPVGLTKYELDITKYDPEKRKQGDERLIESLDIIVKRIDFDGGFAMPKTRTKTSTWKGLLKVGAFLGGGVGLVYGANNVADENFIRGISEVSISFAAIYYSLKSIFSNY